MTLNILQPRAAMESPTSRQVFQVIDDVQYHRHLYGGGLVAATAHVSPHAHVARGARVLGHALVQAGARLFGQAVAEDHSVVCSLVTLRDNARVGGYAVLQIGVNLFEDAYVGGSSVLTGAVTVRSKARIIDICLRGKLDIT